MLSFSDLLIPLTCGFCHLAMVEMMGTPPAAAGLVVTLGVVSLKGWAVVAAVVSATVVVPATEVVMTNELLMPYSVTKWRSSWIFLVMGANAGAVVRNNYAGSVAVVADARVRAAIEIVYAGAPVLVAD